MQLLIKVCGITDPTTATAAATAGADYIGMVFDKNSVRFLPEVEAHAIVQATIAAGAIPVAVFVEQNAETITQICKLLSINTVQLHGNIARSALAFLPEYLHCFYAVPIDEMTGKALCAIPFHTLRRNRDFLLLDNSQAGSGKRINSSQIDSISNGYPYFLAGGLTAKNVKNAIFSSHAIGVDVSSGVEQERGLKDINLIRAFIKNCRAETKP